jgi:hypothetical protein
MHPKYRRILNDLARRNFSKEKDWRWLKSVCCDCEADWATVGSGRTLQQEAEARTILERERSVFGIGALPDPTVCDVVLAPERRSPQGRGLRGYPWPTQSEPATTHMEPNQQEQLLSAARIQAARTKDRIARTGSFPLPNSGRWVSFGMTRGSLRSAGLELAAPDRQMYRGSFLETSNCSGVGAFSFIDGGLQDVMVGATTDEAEAIAVVAEYYGMPDRQVPGRLYRWEFAGGAVEVRFVSGNGDAVRDMFWIGIRSAMWERLFK